jgi:hypothetical protein
MVISDILLKESFSQKNLRVNCAGSSLQPQANPVMKAGNNTYNTMLVPHNPMPVKHGPEAPLKSPELHNKPLKLHHKYFSKR